MIACANREAEMKTLLNGAFLAAMLAATSTSLMAQWPSYPTPRVPMNAAGQPDLNAPRREPQTESPTSRESGRILVALRRHY